MKCLALELQPFVLGTIPIRESETIISLSNLTWIIN